jgi:hypothetical protein
MRHDKNAVQTLAPEEPLSRDEFRKLLESSEGRDRLAKFAVVRSLFLGEFEPDTLCLEPGILTVGSAPMESLGDSDTAIVNDDTNIAFDPSAGAAALTTSFTDLATDMRRHPEFEARLAPWLPILLDRVNLPRAWTEELRAFIMKQLGEVGSQRRFRDLLPGWLDAFARSKGAQPVSAFQTADWETMIRQGAWAMALSQQRDNEPEWIARFCRCALDRKVSSQEELDQVEAPDVTPILVEPLRRQLIVAAAREEIVGRNLFEIGM